MTALRAVPIIIAALGLASAAQAWLIDPYYVDGPQDPLFLPQVQWHELGNMPPFPTGEWITSQWTYTTQTSCFDGNDDPAIPNILIEMTNMTGIAWWDLHYVADPETTITNFDGWIGNVGANDHEEAFRIDYLNPADINFPLVAESMGANEIFEVGETWWFIIQDYGNALGGPPSDFSSLGIAGISQGWPPSTGSIIAWPVPGPGALSVLALAALAGCRRRR